MQFKLGTATDFENILVKLQGYFLSVFFSPCKYQIHLKAQAQRLSVYKSSLKRQHFACSTCA